MHGGGQPWGDFNLPIANVRKAKPSKIPMYPMKGSIHMIQNVLVGTYRNPLEVVRGGHLEALFSQTDKGGFAEGGGRKKVSPRISHKQTSR